MSISPQFLDELRSRLALHEIVGRKVRLNRAGREWKGLCPFHNEKSPSFHVNDEKGFYHCFGCGAHGDAVEFLKVAEGRSFREAVEELSGLAGLEMPRETPQDREKVERLATLQDVMAAAQAWFAEQFSGIQGGKARSYARQRGLSAPTVKQFGIGYAPEDRGGLKAALLAKGVDTAQMVEAGLLIAIDGREPYDRFRGRFMFPIRDQRGRVVGFGGRILGDGEPKYLNSPDTPLFDKGRLLFNLDKAAAPARKSGQIVVVEGYMDVIGLAQAGFAEAVAPMGTALTEDQLALLWRVASEPVLCFDGDNAGQRAAVRAMERALPLLAPGKSLRFVTLPVGKDPDDLVRESGVEAFRLLISQAEPFVERLWATLLKQSDQSTPEQRAAFRKTLFEQVRLIEDPTVRSQYEYDMQTRLRALSAPPQTSAASRTATGWRNAPVVTPRLSAAGAAADPGGLTDKALVIALLQHPAWAERHCETLSQLSLANPQLQSIWQAILNCISESPDLDKERLGNTLQDRGLGEPVSVLLRSVDSKEKRLDFRFTQPDAQDSLAEQDFLALATHRIRMNAAVREMTEAAFAYRAEICEENRIRHQQAQHVWSSLLDGFKELHQGLTSP